MRKVVGPLLALTLLGAGSAFAQDGGVDDAGTPPTDAGVVVDDAGVVDNDGGPTGACGALTVEGECDGTLARYCAGAGTPQEQVVEYDCVDRFPAGPAACGFVSDDWGFDCLIPAGDECNYSDQDGNAVPTFCDNGGACITDFVAQASACTDGTSFDCAPDANTGAATNASCLGNAALYACGAGGNYIGLECEAGGTCNAGVCEGTGEGGVCQPGISECAEGFSCVANACTEGGGEPDPAPGGEPSDEPNPRDPEPAAEPEDEPACSSAHATKTGVPAGLALIALLGLVAIRRRR